VLGQCSLTGCDKIKCRVVPSISHARNVYTVSGKTDEGETKFVHVNI